MGEIGRLDYPIKELTMLSVILWHIMMVLLSTMWGGMYGLYRWLPARKQKNINLWGPY